MTLRTRKKWLSAYLLAASTLFLIQGCRKQADTQIVLWMGNSDIAENRQIATDFLNTFALESQCAHVSLRLAGSSDNYPTGPYWTFEANYPRVWNQDGKPPVSWWMIPERQHEQTSLGEVQGYDLSIEDAVRHICFAAKRQGGKIE